MTVTNDVRVASRTRTGCAACPPRATYEATSAARSSLASRDLVGVGVTGLVAEDDADARARLMPKSALLKRDSSMTMFREMRFST